MNDRRPGAISDNIGSHAVACRVGISSRVPCKLDQSGNIGKRWAATQEFVGFLINFRMADHPGVIRPPVAARIFVREKRRESFAELGGDAVMRNGLLWAHFAPGILRFSSSKKFCRKTTCTGPFSVPAASGTGNTAKRLPSGARSRFKLPA